LSFNLSMSVRLCLWVNIFIMKFYSVSSTPLIIIIIISMQYIYNLCYM
jgi:hypothetical protein